MREPTSSPTHSPGNITVCMHVVVKICAVSYMSMNEPSGIHTHNHTHTRAGRYTKF